MLGTLFTYFVTKKSVCMFCLNQMPVVVDVPLLKSTKLKYCNNFKMIRES